MTHTTGRLTAPQKRNRRIEANSISCLSESNGDTRCKRLELRSVGRVEHIDGIVFEIASQVFPIQRQAEINGGCVVMNLLVEIFLTIPVKLIARFDARIGV